MAKTPVAAFVQTPRIVTAATSAACATITGDAPTNTVLLLTAGADGALLTRLFAMPRATVTASSLLLFTSSDAGTTKRLIDSELMAAFTVVATTAIPETSFANYSESSPLRLTAGEQLYVGNQVAGNVVFRAEVMDY